MVIRASAALLALIPLLAFGQTRSQDSVNWILPVKDKALFFMPAKFVSEGEVREMFWSRDGKYLLVNRTSQAVTPEILEAQFKPSASGVSMPKLVGEILVWNSVTATTRSIKKYDADTTQVSARWLGNANSVAFTFTTQRARTVQLFSSTADGAVRELPPFPESIESTISPLASSAEALLTLRGVDGLETVRKFNVSLQFGPVLNRSTEQFKKFLASSNEVVVSPLVPTDEKGKPVSSVPTYRGINVATGQGRSLTEAEVNPPVEPEVPLKEPKGPTLVSSDMSFSLTGGATRIVLMKAEKESVLVSGDATMALANDQLTAVAFQTQGVILVRPIATVPLAMFESAKVEAEKSKLMTQAKELVKGFGYYAQDHHDTLPGPGGNWKSEVQPYMLHAGLLEGFVLAFEGGVVSSVEKPGETVLGYVYGRNGRVAAYLDGNVRWIPNGK